MQEILLKVPDFIQLVGLFCLALTILATLITRLTPSKADDEFVGKVGGVVMKVLQWLPTIGVNPKTKALEAAYSDLKAQVSVKAPEILVEVKNENAQ